MNVNIDEVRDIFRHLNSATGFSGTYKNSTALLPGPLSTERNSRASSLSHNVPRQNFFTGSSSERMRPWAVQPTRVLHGKHRVAEPRSTGTLTELKQHPEGGGYRALKPAGFSVWGTLVKAALIRTDGGTAGANAPPDGR
ncbi:unnamed protein product [Leuciscus chuanchicus]